MMLKRTYLLLLLLVRIKATPDQNTVSPFSKLDVNQDGNVTAADVSAIYDVLLGNPIGNRYRPYSDVNNDGVVTSGDITAIYNNLLGNN